MAQFAVDHSEPVFMDDDGVIHEHAYAEPSRVMPRPHAVHRRGPMPCVRALPCAPWSCLVCSARSQPRSLHPCGHSLCVRCYDRLDENGSPPGKRCPQCGKLVTSTATNWALTQADQGGPVALQEVQNKISASLDACRARHRTLALGYAAFVARLIEAQAERRTLSLTVSYEWKELEAFLRARKVDVDALTRLNVHRLFCHAIEHIGLPVTYNHTCVEVDRYELELVARAGEE
jgi:hypothetical protein